MTKDEALKLALEALENINNADNDRDFLGPKECCDLDNAITAMREVLAQTEPIQFKCTVVDDDHPDGVPLSKWGRHPDQEPFCYHDGRNIVGKEFADHSDVFPLYTSPPPCQTCEALARTVMLDQTSHDAQRQWVGLTEEEHTQIAIDCGCMSADWVFYGAAVERNLKEKNT